MFSNLRSLNRVALRSARSASVPRVSFSSRARRSHWFDSIVQNTSTTPRTNFFGPQWCTTNPRHQCLQQCQYQGQPKSRTLAKVSACLAALATLYGLARYISNYGHEVPFVGRKRFEFDKSTHLVEKEYQYNKVIRQAMIILELAQSHCPETIWPEDHPNTIATQRIFKQLLEANGMQNQDWEIHVLNAPGK